MRAGRLGMLGMLAGALLVPGCDEGAGPLAIISITNTWQEEGDADHTFSFSDDANFTPRAAGTFTGTETLPNGTTYDFAGDWRNGRVRFTVQRTIDVTYTANFHGNNPDRLEFTSSAGDLVLVRNVN